MPFSQSCPTLCYPMDYRTPGFPVHQQLPELAQTHAHRVGDAIQLSHPLSSPSPPAFNFPASGSFPMSQLLASGGQSTVVSASTLVLPRNTQGWSSLGWTGWTRTVCTRTQGPHRDWDRTVFEHLLWRFRSSVICHRDRGSGCSRPGYGISPLEGGCH